MRDPIDQVLDAACGLFYAHDAAAGRLTRLHVGPDAYAAICRARRRDLERGLPVLVLDLDLVVDPALSGSEVRVSCDEGPAEGGAAHGAGTDEARGRRC